MAANTNVPASTQTTPVHTEGLTLIRETKQSGTWVGELITKNGRFVNKVRVLVALEDGFEGELIAIKDLGSYTIVDSLSGLSSIRFN
jgi:hypothetical protein